MFTTKRRKILTLSLMGLTAIFGGIAVFLAIQISTRSINPDETSAATVTEEQCQVRSKDSCVSGCSWYNCNESCHKTGTEINQVCSAERTEALCIGKTTSESCDDKNIACSWYTCNNSCHADGKPLDQVCPQQEERTDWRASTSDGANGGICKQISDSVYSQCFLESCKGKTNGKCDQNCVDQAAIAAGRCEAANAADNDDDNNNSTPNPTATPSSTQASPTATSVPTVQATPAPACVNMYLNNNSAIKSLTINSGQSVDITMLVNNPVGNGNGTLGIYNRQNSTNNIPNPAKLPLTNIAGMSTMVQGTGITLFNGIQAPTGTTQKTYKWKVHYNQLRKADSNFNNAILISAQLNGFAGGTSSSPNCVVYITTGVSASPTTPTVTTTPSSQASPTTTSSATPTISGTATTTITSSPTTTNSGNLPNTGLADIWGYIVGVIGLGTAIGLIVWYRRVKDRWW
jgi:LPXTG-motif cell wall-anchored protein